MIPVSPLHLNSAMHFGLIALYINNVLTSGDVNDLSSLTFTKPWNLGKMDNTVDSKIDRGKILWRSERSKPSVFCLIDPTNSNNKRMFVAPRWDQNEGSNIKQTSTLWQEYNSIYDMPYSRGTKCYTMPALDSCSDLQDGEKLGSYLNSIYGELNVSSRDCRVAYYDFFY